MFESPRRNSAGLKPLFRGLWLTAGLLIICFCFVFTPLTASAQSSELNNAPLIFDVRRSLPLEPDEPVYRDFYINAGVEAGFKKGMYITVVRLIPVHDPLQNKQQGELQVGVARLQFIEVTRNLSVARLHSEFTNDERPALEFEGVMIGDRVDPASMTMQAPPQKKKSAQANELQETFASTAAVEPNASNVNPVLSVQPALAAQEDQLVPFGSEAQVTESASQEAPPVDIVRVPVPASTGSANVPMPTNPSM